MKQIFRIAMALLLTMSVSTLYAQQPEKQQTKKAEQKVEKKKADSRQQTGTNQGKPQRIKIASKDISATKMNIPDGIDPMVAAVFPKVEKVEENDVWNKVLDGNGNLLGFVVYSSPASDEIKGYAGPTPLLIAFDEHKTIIAVCMLPNKETPKYRNHIDESGLLNSWNGLSIKDAKKKKVDAVSGATFTSKSIIDSFRAILEKL